MKKGTEKTNNSEHMELHKLSITAYAWFVGDYIDSACLDSGYVCMYKYTLI